MSTGQNGYIERRGQGRGQDTYGLSWQIIPQRMLDMFADKDAAKAKRAMDAMLKMGKIDLATLEKAFAG